MDALHIISWNVTGRCNLNCTHCYLPAGTREESLDISASDELTTGEALQLIDQIAIVNPEAMLILSGGEPLLRKDIFELAAYASGKGIMVVLGSNGLLLDEEVALKLKQSGVSGISISLDSIDPEIHDAIRSLKGSWEKAKRAIHICKNGGLSVQINTVVTERNYDEIPGLIEYSETLGVKVYSPFFLVCTGRGEKLTDILPQQYERLLSFIVKTQGKRGDMMIRTRCAPTFRRILHESDPASPLLRMDTGRCLAGVHYCRITPKGDITPCPYMSLPVGNVRRHDFGDLWRNSDIFDSLRNPLLKGKCGKCAFRLICGGCRARSYAVCGDFLGEDPWCAYVPGEKDEIKPNTFDTVSNPVTVTHTPLWTEEAEERLKRVPSFVRSMVRGAVERYAIENNYGEITPNMMEEARHKLLSRGVGGHS